MTSATLQRQRHPVVPQANPARAAGFECEAIRKIAENQPCTTDFFVQDATRAWPDIKPIDLIVTSPPYWQKRDYGVSNQLGQESTLDEYASNLGIVLGYAKDALEAHGSIFLNVGDTIRRGEFQGVPGAVEYEARKQGLQVRNRITWTKTHGIPESSQKRLASRSEVILHLTKSPRYYYDLHGYSNTYGSGANPGDVWQMKHQPKAGNHLAPFPDELVARSITLAAPLLVDVESGKPVERVIERTLELDESRPQARRALELAEEYGLSEAHLRAVQSVGINDAGKAKGFQASPNGNLPEVIQLAKEAKDALGGYFREFTFAKRATKNWELPEDRSTLRLGRVMDPFAGTGTTLKIAEKMHRSSIGFDLKKWSELGDLAH